MQFSFVFVVILCSLFAVNSCCFCLIGNVAEKVLSTGILEDGIPTPPGKSWNFVPNFQGSAKSWKSKL